METDDGMGRLYTNTSWLQRMTTCTVLHKCISTSYYHLSTPIQFHMKCVFHNMRYSNYQWSWSFRKSHTGKIPSVMDERIFYICQYCLSTFQKNILNRRPSQVYYLILLWHSANAKQRRKQLFSTTKTKLVEYWFPLMQLLCNNREKPNDQLPSFILTVSLPVLLTPKLPKESRDWRID